MNIEDVEKKALELYPNDVALREAYVNGVNDFMDDIEEDLDFANMLKKLKEEEKKVKLNELINFWWIQEDSEGNKCIFKKDDFTQAMKKAYSVGIAKTELTWEDILSIIDISNKFVRNNTKPMSDKEYAEEVLKRFKKKKS